MIPEGKPDIAIDLLARELNSYFPSTYQRPCKVMSRGSSPDITCVQPDHFYPTGVQNVRKDDPGTLYDPEQDPFATRGIPVFRPTIDEFKDFEGYMEKVEVWGRKSGIVKIVPPAEWTKALPSTVPLLPEIKLKSPIEQRMDGGSGLFRQQNIEKRKTLSVMDWVNMCNRSSLKAPSPNQTARGARTNSRETQSLGHGSGVGEADAPNATPSTTNYTTLDLGSLMPEESAFYSSFDPHSSWLPPNTKPSDYTPEACRNLERTFWRTCGIATPAWYGADMQGSLFTDATTTFNVAHLPSFLSRLRLSKPLPGVNTPYLYFGMWRATFAWHVEDMDLYSINYIHWGAPKFWYAVPSERSNAFEGVMRGYFPSDTSTCPEFLRHKSYLASPNLLAQSACRPNVLVQHQGEFVITFPRGYHAGFNLGLNCAESVNFALENWVELGRKAGFCQCVPDSVRIDVDALIAESAQIQEQEKLGDKRKPVESDAPTAAKRKRMNPLTAVPRFSSAATNFTGTKVPALTIKIAKREDPAMQCCLCASISVPRDSTLLRCVNGPPLYTGMKPLQDHIDKNGTSNFAVSPGQWMAHEHCAMVIPETWVDVVEGEKMVFGVDCIVRDRWNLKCSLCVKLAHKKHGAKIQCTRGKCSKAFHVSCAIDQEEVDYKIVEETESEVVLIDGTQDLLPSHGANSGKPLTVDSTASIPAVAEPSTRTIKIVRKYLVSVLCSQHNPVIQEHRRLQRLEKVKTDLLALPIMSRIRVRVSSGVFEVTLLAVDEQSNSVTVLWGDGVRRELKWGSIVWNTPTASSASELTEGSKNAPPDAPLDSASGPSSPSAPTQISVRKPRPPRQPRPPVPKPSMPKWQPPYAESSMSPYPHVPRLYASPLHTTYPYHPAPYPYPHHYQPYATVPYSSAYQPMSHGVTWPRDPWIPPEFQHRPVQPPNIVSSQPSLPSDSSNQESSYTVQATPVPTPASLAHPDTSTRADPHWKTIPKCEILPHQTGSTTLAVHPGP